MNKEDSKKIKTRKVRKKANTKKATSKTTKSKKESKQQKQISIFSVLLILLVVATCVGIYFGIRYLGITLKYKQYTDKMISYGYSELYNNNQATATEKVTNDELIKVILGVVSNTKKVENDNWYNYGIEKGLDLPVAEANLEDKANRLDAVMFLTELVQDILNIDINKAELKINEKDLSSFSQEEQEVLAKAIELGLIKNNKSSLKEKELLKGELNKMIIIVAEKYATMYYETIKIEEDGTTQKQQVNIVTDKKEKPGNYNDYPYIIDTIDKSVYEQGYKILTESKFVNPKETYNKIGYLYGQIAERITSYFDTILNVDYATITKDNFSDGINKDIIYGIDEKTVNEYINHVKTNKIKLEGSATPLIPIIYNNGEQYVVRTKITFKVLSSDTDTNLLFGDETSNVKYTSKDVTMYVDLPMGMTLNSNSLRVYVTCLAKEMSTTNNTVVIEEK